MIMESFDPNSGARIPGALPAPSGKDDCNWAVAAHLSAFAGHLFPFGNIVGPLVIWLMKRDSSVFVEDQAKEALNAQISYTAYGVICALLVFVVIGIFLAAALYVAVIVFVIRAALSVSKGKPYRYPLIFRLVT
jgi:uncharacterized Tic20 family protein